MADERDELTGRDELSRRDALKSITAGVGVIATLPVIGIAQGRKPAPARGAGHDHHGAKPGQAQAKAEPLKFFTADENRAVIEMSERIIPADESSPGAKAARVNEYIDLVVSVSPEEVKRAWREGLAAVDNRSQELVGKRFAEASEAEQVKLLEELARNEKSPKSVEEKFFRTIKNATIDGYYTSEIGIHQELKYKGNTYLKEFVGCTHPEHQK